jgi:hypothetical protein
MKVLGIIDEDLVNYKVPSMVIEMPKCDFKCDKECGMRVCQNSALAAAPPQEINIMDIILRYVKNDITSAIVFQGLEPFDSWDDLLLFCKLFRYYCNIPTIVIYTGYKEEEIKDKVKILQKCCGNFIIKYGRYIPNQESHYDEILGVELASPNQYAVYYE